MTLECAACMWLGGVTEPRRRLGRGRTGSCRGPADFSLLPFLPLPPSHPSGATQSRQGGNPAAGFLFRETRENQLHLLHFSFMQPGFSFSVICDLKIYLYLGEVHYLVDSIFEKLKKIKKSKKDRCDILWKLQMISPNYAQVQSQEHRIAEQYKPGKDGLHTWALE